MTYLIIYDFDEFAIYEAADIRECIIKFANHVGDNSTLFNKALIGCDTTAVMVDMFNHFSQSTINTIYTINDIVYNKE